MPLRQGGVELDGIAELARRSLDRLGKADSEASVEYGAGMARALAYVAPGRAVEAAGEAADAAQAMALPFRWVQSLRAHLEAWQQYDPQRPRHEDELIGEIFDEHRAWGRHGPGPEA